MTLNEQIMKLQTYKMFEGEDTVYVERDDVLKLLEQEPKWISVNERLPDKLQDVVVTFYDAEGECDIAYMRKTFNASYKAQESENEWVSSMGETTYADYEVIAWMPLPEPYRAESEEQA